MIFADFTIRIGAGGVEIAQRHEADAVGALVMRQRALDRELGLAVAVDRLLRVGFGNRCLDRLAVGRTGRREDEVFHRFGRHRLEYAQRSDDVVAVVARRLAYRFADVEQGREMHDRDDLVAAQRVAHPVDIRDVAFDQLAVLHRRAMAGREVVVHDDAVLGPVQRLGRMTADVPRAAGDENGASGGVPTARTLRGGVRSSAQWRNR